MNICHFYGNWEARSDRQCHLVNCTHQRRDVVVNVTSSGKICIFNKTSQGNNKNIFGIPEGWEIRIWANKNKTRGLKLRRASWVKVHKLYYFLGGQMCTCYINYNKNGSLIVYGKISHIQLKLVVYGNSYTTDFPIYHEN